MRFLNPVGLDDDPAFASALYAFLAYLHAHRPVHVPALEALPVPRVKGLQTGTTAAAVRI